MEFESEIEQLIDAAIAEDIRTGDITSEACIPETATTSGRFILKQAGVIAGLPFLEKLFQKIDPEITVTLFVEEGSYQTSGTMIGKVSGPARGILSGERTALNILQHASGIATVTAAYIRKLVGIDCAIMDTRKTLPGLRALEKYAVRVGGGVNYRFGLDDHFTIKNNHLSFVAGTTNEPIKEAVRLAKTYKPEVPIEVEITQLDQLQEVLDTEAGAIMLSRMLPSTIHQCVKEIRKTNKKVYIESLGAVTLDTVRAYAETGVDGIAIGSLTHSADGLDIRLRLGS